MKGLKVMKKFVSILLVFTLASTLLFAMTAFAADKNPVYYMLIGKKDCTKLDVFNQNIVSETGATVCLTGAYVNYVTDYEKMMNMDQFEKEQSAASELFTDKKAAQDLADSLNKSSMDISMIYPFADVGLFTVNYYDFQVVAIQ